MIRIATRAAPPEFVRLRAARAAFSELSSEPSIRRALWEQQGRRCAYCERLLRDPSRDDHQTRIEHFHPQSSAQWNTDCKRASGAGTKAKAPTTWSNLLLCCDGNESVGKPFTCDKSKDDIEICADFRNPKLWSGHPDRLVNIDREGRAEPVVGLPARASHVVDDVLNLNAEHVVEARQRVATPRRQELKKWKARHQGLDDQQRAVLVERWRTRAETSPYGTALLSLADWLERT
jgi:uncharacterized protein (TIGR02646 family)